MFRGAPWQRLKFLPEPHGHPATIDGLTMLIQGVLRQDPFSGHLFVFRGSKANLIKIVFWDGGLCLFTKRLEQSVFLWPPDVDPGETLALSSDRSEDPTCHGMPGQSIGSTALARSTCSRLGISAARFFSAQP